MQKLDERVMQPALRDDDIDLQHFAHIIGRRKWSIIGFALLMTLLAALYAISMKPVYRASATLLIEGQAPNVVSIADVYGADTHTQQYYETQFEILKSRPLAEKVVTQLNLTSRPEFSWHPAPWAPLLNKLNMGKPRPNPFPVAVDRYEQILDVAPTPKTQLVKVSFDSRDPALAAAVANAHARAYIESYLEAKEAMTRSASEWMSSRAGELRQQLTDSEQRLQAFKEREHLLDIDSGIQSLPTHELNDLSTKLIEARRVLSENRNVFDQVNMARDASLDEKLAIPAVNVDPLVKQFREQRADALRKVAEIAKRYGPLHPKMKAALSERDEAQRSLESHVESVMDSIRNQQSVLQGQAQAVAIAVSNTKADVQSVSRKGSQYRALVQEVETNRELYSMFYKRISETKEANNLAATNARVIEPAEPPLTAARPKKALIVALAFVAALSFGVVLVVLADLMHATLNSSLDIEQKIGLPLLGLLPRVRRSRKFSKYLGREYADQADPKFGEAVRTLRTAIGLSNLDASHKLIMVTSSCGGEGKTSVACNLALAFAQLERVLLIDADLRHSSVAKEFGLGDQLPGLAELCQGTADVDSCIVRVGNDKLDIITAGLMPVSPQELLSSQRIHEMMKKLKSTYDRIIVDTSPVLPVSDALLLANRADALVYVIKADSTKIGQVRAGLQLIRRTPVVVLGVILNQINLEKTEEYGSAHAYSAYASKGAHQHG
jgi:capsular exopolysaccharide synthesis family protein